MKNILASAGRSLSGNFGLAAAFSFLFALSFPPVPFGILASVAFVPLILLMDRPMRVGMRFRLLYGAFSLASLFTLYWVGGFTSAKDPYLMMAGVLLLIWQPFYFLLPMGVYAVVKKNLGRTAALLAFPCIWVTFEWLYALGEFSFPWLTLGNTQTYQLVKIQFAEITGVYGISFWLLTLNMIAVLLIDSWRSGESIVARKSIVLTGAFLLLYMLPNVYTMGLNQNKLVAIDASSIRVGIIQPNLDPWEKWEGGRTQAGRDAQTERYIQKIRELKQDSVAIAVLPETAILFNLPTHPEQLMKLRGELEPDGISLISGFPDTKYYRRGESPGSSAMIQGTDVRYDVFNAILYLQPGSDLIQIYDKMRLVPFAERLPYAEAVPFLIEPLRWNVGISNWGMGKDSTIFADGRLRTKFLSMICYESIFPEFVASFVHRGAEFLVFITNDSWWGNTSGARQHNQYAVLRAIENRRWVVRCANGGISSVINPWGTMIARTEMYVETSITAAIQPRTIKTFYTEHGDLLARILALVTVVTFFSAHGRKLMNAIVKKNLEGRES
ncbi:MAG: apolipoprotein N-acyltransferase [Ignavibacteriales bacterium]|nr:apolipoprotein N-acyltransferase [Ignavibacteriales bacterium]